MTGKYNIAIHWSVEDSAFIAEVPELAGCMADGRTHVEALQNTEIVIGEWLETVQLIGRYAPALPCGL